MKGVAILLMLMHHSMAFPDRIPQKYEFAVSSSGLKHLILVGSFGKICVAIFMFLGGLGLAKQIQANNFHFLKKVWGLYRVYWRVFLYSFHLVFSFLAGNRNIHKRLCGIVLPDFPLISSSRT